MSSVLCYSWQQTQLARYLATATSGPEEREVCRALFEEQARQGMVPDMVTLGS